MKPKNLVTAALLLFVAASIVVLVVKSLPQHPPAAETGGREAVAAPAEATAAASPPLSDGVIAYYFHGNVRCPTCRSIESYAHEAVESRFSERLKEGRIGWRVVNYEQPGNEHFLTDYELVFPSVVLVKMRGGRRTDWKNLDRVWELVGEKAEFVQYVQQETRAFLEGAST